LAQTGWLINRKIKYDLVAGFSHISVLKQSIQLG